LFLVFFFDRFVECDEDDGDFLLNGVGGEVDGADIVIVDEGALY
jgi:hypothetical protein